MNWSSTRLSSPLSDDLKREIISRFWRKPKSEIHLEDYTAYFQFYQNSCEALYLGIRSEVKSLISESHEHVLAIVDAFWSISSALLSRPSLRQQLGERFGSEKEMNDGNSYNARLNNSINLALRLWLTIVIRDSVFAPAASAIEWDDHSTLQEFLKRQFPAPRLIQTPSEKDNTMILRSDFTAVNLRRIGGINIDWTCDLSEHLKFDRETRRLKIYMLMICLYDQKASGASAIPTAVIDETILSLQLLFPDWDPETSKILEKIDQPIHIQENIYPDRLYVSDFYYWRDRLSEVCFEYQSPPSAWRQIWTDRRNRLQWYTFWLAMAIFILTIVFGLIGSVTACLQTRYAYEALQLAREAAKGPL